MGLPLQCYKFKNQKQRDSIFEQSLLKKIEVRKYEKIIYDNILAQLSISGTWLIQGRLFKDA
jgi:hypothetical protein